MARCAMEAKDRLSAVDGLHGLHHFFLIRMVGNQLEGEFTPFPG